MATPNRLLPKDKSGHVSFDYDVDEEVFKVALKVWNPTTLQWERMTQPVVESTGDLTVTMGDVERATNGTYWGRTRSEYDANGNCIYKGLHPTFNAAEGDTGYYIIKYSYDVNGNNTDKQMTTGSWTNRASLGW